MMLHHGRYHACYVEKLNTVLEDFPDLQQKSALWLVLNLDKVPGDCRVAVRNNAGGPVNHIRLVPWALGLVSASSIGGVIHVVLVIAIVMVLLRVIDRRNPV